MKKPSYQELEARVRELEREASERRRFESELLEKQAALRKQNINMVRKSIELSDTKRELEDRNYELELIRSELRDQNINLVRKSIELSDMMRQFEDKNYDLELSQADLERAEEEIRVIADNVPALVSYIDEDGCYRFVNKRYEEWFGLPRTEIVGKHCREVLGEATYELIRDRVEEAISGHQVCYEEALPYARGGTRWVLAEYVPDADDRGEVKGFFALVTDITEHKQAEEEIRQRNRELTTLLDVSQRVTSQLDLDESLGAIARSIVETLPAAEAASLWLYDEQRNEMVVRAWAGHDEESVAGLRLSPDTSLVGLVYRTCQPHITDNADSEPTFEPVGRPSLDAVRSVLGVPLLVEGRPIGALFADNFSRRQAFDDNALRLLQSLAAQAAIAIENARLYEAERKRSAELEALRQASLRLTSTLELQPVLETILDHTLKLVAADDAHVFLYDGEKLSFGAATWADAYQHRPYAEPRPQGLTYTVARTGECIAIPDTNSHPLFQDYRWGGAIVGLPLRVGEQVVGVMNIAFLQPHVFSEDELRVLGLLADQAAIAIQNARLYERTERSLEQLTALRQTSLAITARLNTTALLEAIVRRATELLKAKGGGLYLYDPARQELTVAVDHGLKRSVVGTTLKLGEGLSGRVMQTGEPMIVDDYRTWSGRSEKYAEDQFSAVVEVPLKWQDQVIGTLAMVDDIEKRVFTEDDAQLLGLFADQAAIAIENARLYEETRHRATELSTLYEVVTAGMTSVRLDEILNRIMTALQETLQPDDIAILLVETETNELVTRTHAGFPGGPELTRRSIGVGVPGRVVQTGQPVLLADVRKDEHYHACDPGTRSELCVPLRVGERIIGALNLESHRRAAFSEDDLRLLSILAGHLSAVIENARLFEEIEERRLYLEGVLGAAPDAIVALDAHHRIVEWNTGAEKLFGYSREEVIGRDIDRLVTNPDTIEEAAEFRQIVMSGKDLPPVETVRYRKDGSRVDVLLAASPIMVGDELIGVAVVYTDITERVRAEEQLAYIATHDSLTGVPNRLGFLTLAEQQLKMAHRARKRMVLLFADFDHLKQINDAFGHSEGDQALVEVAHVLEETFRESDIIGRIGGDEFAVLAVETDDASIEILVTRLQENLEARNATGDLRYELSLSVGLARYDPEAPCSIDELLARADRSMYEKKQCN